MSWADRTYLRVGTSARYTCEVHRGYILPPDLNLTKPWAGTIRADYVLGTWGERDTLTGLRSAPSGPPGLFVGDIRQGEYRRLLVALLDADSGRLFVAVYGQGMPRHRRRVIAAAGARLAALAATTATASTPDR